MNFEEEKRLQRKGFKKIAGLDEAGRGPLAGPVTAAAVTVWQFSIFPPSPPPSLKLRRARRLRRASNLQLSKKLKEVKDSKKLTPKKREELYKVLINHPAIEWGVGRVGHKVIDRINIFEATKLAMKRAVANLVSKVEGRGSRIDFLILDGNIRLDLDIPQKSIIKADQKVFSCAAASIIAKVIRDRAMKNYDKKYPGYGLLKHKGYPTKHHREMLEKYGPCKIHRRTFGPVKNY